MGWETLATVGFSLLSAGSTASSGDAAARAAAEKGTRDAKTIADNTVRAAGKLQTSFLQSGLTLEGGPSDVIAAAFNQGRTDIDSVATNANNEAKNYVSAARTKALNGLASSFSGIFSGSLFDGTSLDSTFESGASALPDSFAFGLNDAGYGKSAYNILSASDGWN